MHSRLGVKCIADNPKGAEYEDVVSVIYVSNMRLVV